MRMDHYGRMVDTLTDMWEALDASDLVDEAAPVRRALERAMAACVTAERIRWARARAIETCEAMAQGAKARTSLRAA
ncbi:MAG: hypothetical protein EON95_10765 [Caulobacteraceae bacterium]|nr:hypothetical protein [Caulobacter sp.]RYF92913.1 MAG: hypothetical protein EON95_10765 [Caulobacteraceae bacterium]